ncbi:hypothetical protein MC885_005911, partial [Smutsia gigantea]
MTSQRPCPADDFGIYYGLEAGEAEGDQPRVRGVAGLRNLGDPGYGTAVLQCLCSASPLGAHFLSGKHTTALQKHCSEAAKAFANAVTDMWPGDSDCVSPELFRSALGNLYPAFMKKTQQDAQEFLVYVLTELHEALQKVSRISGLKCDRPSARSATCPSRSASWRNLPTLGRAPVLGVPEETAELYHRKRSHEKGSIPICCRRVVVNESSIITRLFEGQLNSSIICLKCENCTYKNAAFTVLSLPIPSEYECTSGLSPVFLSTRPTDLEQPNPLPSVKPSKKQLFDILGTMKRKLRTDIHYALTDLDPTPYMCPVFRKHPKYNLCTVVFGSRDMCEWGSEAEEGGSNGFMLNDHEPLCSRNPQTPASPVHKHQAIPGFLFWIMVLKICFRTPLGFSVNLGSSCARNHFGDLDGGHHTAFCKNSVTHAWYSFDDTRVSEIPDTLVQTATAYLLFYSCQPFSIPIQK